MEIILVVLKFVKCLTRSFSFRPTTETDVTDLLNGNIPLEGHGETTRAIMRVTILREEHQGLHILQVGSGSWRIFLYSGESSTNHEAYFTCLREQSKDFLGFIAETSSESVFCTFGVQKPVLQIQKSSVVQGPCSAIDVSTALEYSSLTGIQFGKSGCV